jgi:hypothetical protein
MYIQVPSVDRIFLAISSIQNSLANVGESMSSSSTSEHLPALTTLCPICYTNPPKYRCPRCSMRTCSMECSKAHKIRASCSGLRDPAKYVSRKDMRASTIDMDYNFLQNIRKTREEGYGEIEKVGRGKARNKRQPRKESDKRRAMREARSKGLIMEELPSWMERSKQNQTKWDNRSKTILWTVEWIITVADETTTVLQHKYEEQYTD